MAPVFGFTWIDMFSRKAFWMGSKRREVWTVKVRASWVGGMVSSSASDGVDEGVYSGLRCTSDLDCISEALSGEDRVESVEVIVFTKAL
jgi:hypothetical protein